MKVYTKTYSHLFESIAKAKPSLSVATGKMVSFQIPFPSEGFMERVVVKQASGTAVGYHVELLNSKLPYPPGVYNSGAGAADALQFYRIQIPPTGPLIAASGTVMTYYDDDFALGFRNIDGGFTDNQRYIYLLIDPQSAGTTTTWDVLLQCRTDVG